MSASAYANGVAEIAPGSPEEAVWSAMQEIYAQTLAGEVATVTALMHPHVTLWDSEIEPLALGVPHLLALRAEKPADAAAEMTLAALEASDPVVSVWGDTALLRHILTVRFAEAEQPDVVVRNTSVWRFEQGRWLLAHNHEGVWPSA